MVLADTLYISIMLCAIFAEPPFIFLFPSLLECNFCICDPMSSINVVFMRMDRVQFAGVWAA